VKIKLSLVGAIAAFALVSAACQIFEFPFREQYAKLEAIKVGMSEAEVKQKLGEPDFVHKMGVTPEQYCRPGWTCDKHLIVGHLFIYLAGKPIAYVYFDRANQVEHVFIGGT
jgi:hypothetical protein